MPRPECCVTTDGSAWHTWCEGTPPSRYVFTQKEDGPKLRVSTGGNDAAPMIRADEYNNVWIAWWSPQAREIRICRMGPRSGREVVACDVAYGPARDLTVFEGRIRVTCAGGDGRSITWEGTENDGFQQV